MLKGIYDAWLYLIIHEYSAWCDRSVDTGKPSEWHYPRDKPSILNTIYSTLYGRIKSKLKKKKHEEKWSLLSKAKFRIGQNLIQTRIEE